MEKRLLERDVLFVRSVGDKLPHKAEGYAAVFYDPKDEGTEYVRFGFHERIARAAFDRALKEGQDVVAKFNHDSNYVLGRTSNGTVRLEVDDVGLHYSIDLPDTSVGRDLAISLERGDVKGSSFAFEPVSFDTENMDNGDIIVTVTDVDLGDVGPVVHPCYEATVSELRNSEGYLARLELARKTRDHRRRRVRDLDIAEDILKT